MKQYGIVAVTAILAVAFCFLIRQFMPGSVRQQAIEIVEAHWIVNDSVNDSEDAKDRLSSFPMKLGYTLHSQLPEGVPCCSGTYLIDIPASALASFRAEKLKPAIFLPAIGGDFSITLNKSPVIIPIRKEHSSVGPLIPIEADMLQQDLKIEISVGGAATPYNGLWKGPLLIGDYFTLFDQMEAERTSQIIIPTMNGIGLLLFSFLFLFLYYVSGKQADFFLRIGTAFILYAVFDIYLSGFARHQNLYFGFVTHYPVRGITNIGTFLIMTSFLDIVGERAVSISKQEKVFTYLGLVMLAFINLLFGIAGHWVVIVWMVSLSLILPFWPLIRWPFRKCAENWYGRLTLFVVFFALFSTSADAVKLTSRLFQLGVPYGYFSRYTTIVLIIAAIVLATVFFRRIFVTLERDRLRLMKSQGIGRAIKMLAHDVRKPFSIMKIGLNVLESKANEEKDDYAKKLKNEMTRNLNSVNTMLSDIMEFGGTCRLALENTNLSELILESIDETAAIYTDKSINVKSEIPASLLSAIDRLKIKRVLQNLLHNAFQATGMNGAIKVSAAKNIDGTICVQVFNSNSFLSEEKRLVIFDEFYTSDKANGTGLGLAIAKEFVEAHNGRIWCESKQNWGTSFFLELKT